MVVGVLADTHVPDRVRRLNPRIPQIFKEAGVADILHAGDVSAPRVLEELGKIAPVHAVRGNRDWIWLHHLPFSVSLTCEGVTIAMTHGHGGWWNYLVDRVHYLAYGYQMKRFQSRLVKGFPEARVIVFGHTHRPLNLWVDGQLLFNPGSAHFPEEANLAPSVGLLHIQAGGEVWAEIVDLDD